MPLTPPPAATCPGTAFSRSAHTDPGDTRDGVCPGGTGASSRPSFQLVSPDDEAMGPRAPFIAHACPLPYRRSSEMQGWCKFGFCAALSARRVKHDNTTSDRFALDRQDGINHEQQVLRMWTGAPRNVKTNPPRPTLSTHGRETSIELALIDHGN